MKKHEYVETGVLEVETFKFPSYECKHCGHTTSQSTWQLHALPKSMAKCKKSNKRSRFFEWFNFDCLE